MEKNIIQRVCSRQLWLAFLCMPTLMQAATDPAYDFILKHRNLITPVWDKPFSYKEIESQHAPIGPYLGNGDIGAVAYTSDNSQTLLLSKVDFVTDGWSDWAGTGAAALPAGEVSIRVDSNPAGGFRYEMNQVEACLTMQTGTQQPVTMETWMTRNEDYVVTRLTNTSDATVDISVETRSMDNPTYKVTASTAGDVAQVTRQTKTEGGVNWICRVGISTRIVGTPSTLTLAQEPRPSVTATFSLRPHASAHVVTLLSGGGKGDDARLATALRQIGRLTPRRIKTMQKANGEWWHEMWSRSWADTGDDLLNRQYLTSIYLMVSAYNPTAPSCGGMYGVWNMHDKMMYHGDIHLNYNSQAGFYSMYSANRPELSLPYFDFLERVMPEGRRRAQTEMGLVHPSLKGKRCRGFLFPVSALGIGEFYCQYWQQTMNAPFNIPLWSWYYEYTGDTDFLRNRAYPFLKECGEFYEDYLQKVPHEGSYRYQIVTGGHENSWDVNPPSDLAFVEQNFRLLLRYSELLGTDEACRPLWNDIVTHLPPYKVILPTKEPNDGKPVFAKNDEGWDWPAHVIQMHCAYPCEVLHLHSDPELRQTGLNTIHYYSQLQRGFTETMNELGLSAFVMGARLGYNPQTLLDNLKILAGRAGSNLLIRDGHHCLEKTTVVETIHSMMLQSVDGILHLFPDWPHTPASFHQIRTKGAFLVSARYDGSQTTELRIKSLKGNVCMLDNPWPGKQVRITQKGKVVEATLQGGIITFSTTEGATYQLAASE